MKGPKKKKVPVTFFVTKAEKEALEAAAAAKDLTLSAFLRGSCEADSDFIRLIKERQPEWFVDSADEKKKALLEIPVGAPRPSQKTTVGKALSNYTPKSGSSYDANFDKMIRAKQPEWFIHPDDKKKALLDLAASGAPRPKKGERIPWKGPLYKRKKGKWTPGKP
jgi:hypothetical protein